MKYSTITRPFVWTIGKVTEQANVVSIILTMMAAATCYGWIEGTLYVYYPYSNQLEIAGHFTWYHTIMLALFFVVGFSISVSRVLQTGLRKWYLPAASFGSVAWGFWIEDMVYFATVRYNPDPQYRGVLNSSAWVNFGVAGNNLYGFWVPNIYLLLCAGGFALFATAFVISRKDLVFRMGLTPKKISTLRKIAVGLAFLILTEFFGILARILVDIEVTLWVQIRIIAIFLVLTVSALLLLLLTDLAVRRMGEPLIK